MKLARKLISMVLYAALLLPGSEYRVTSWLKAVELTSTALDRTMRRRRSQITNAELGRFLRELSAESETKQTATPHRG